MRISRKVTDYRLEIEVPIADVKSQDSVRGKFGQIEFYCRVRFPCLPPLKMTWPMF